MIGAPLLLLFFGSGGDSIIVVADESLYGLAIDDASLYGCTITDTMANNATVTDATAYGCTLTDDDAYGCTVADALLTGDTPVAYDIGDVARLSSAFTNTAGAAADPTAVTVKVRPPSGEIITRTYAASEIVKDSTGNYHFDYTILEEGVHYYKFYGTGAVVAAEESSFEVQTSEF